MDDNSNKNEIKITFNITQKLGKTKIDFDELDQTSTTCTHPILKAK